jgi:hypothetical protein
LGVFAGLNVLPKPTYMNTYAWVKGTSVLFIYLSALFFQ